MIATDDFNLKLVYANILDLINENFEIEKNKIRQNEVTINRSENEDYITNNTSQISRDFDNNETFIKEDYDINSPINSNQIDSKLQTSRKETNDLFISDLNLGMKTFNSLRRNLKKIQN